MEQNINSLDNSDLSGQDQAKKVDDIFAETENELVSSQNNIQTEEQEYAGERNFENGNENRTSLISMSKVELILVVVFTIVLLGIGGYYGYGFYKNRTNNNLEMESNNEGEPVEENKTSGESNQAITPEEEKEEPVNTAKTESQKPVDSDQDGLTDEEERELGTNINNIDSDNDGLYDREEVKVYKTNPLDSDTDNDGHFDGEEVKAGYDPRGPGRLYELN